MKIIKNVIMSAVIIYIVAAVSVAFHPEILAAFKAINTVLLEFLKENSN